MKIINKNFLTNKHILAVCPTRKRINLARKMFSSFDLNRSGYADIIFCLDDDDPFLDEYEKIFTHRCAYCIQPRKTITQIFNKMIMKTLPDYPMYHLTNDDFTYYTKHFDYRIYKAHQVFGKGVYYGNDMFQRKEMCTAPFIDTELIKAVGWAQMPELTHLYGDNVWYALSKGLDILNYLEQIIIQHEHPLITGEEDDTFKYTNSEEMFRMDFYMFYL